jgi:chromosome segregation ATPase
MPEVKKTELDELTELRERVKALEEDLQKERAAKDKAKEDKTALTDSMEKLADEFSRLSRGIFFAGMESLALTADMTRTFVDKTAERNTPERRDTISKLVTNLPVDVTRSFFDALDEYVDKSEKVVDKFYEKYKEK